MASPQANNSGPARPRSERNPRAAREGSAGASRNGSGRRGGSSGGAGLASIIGFLAAAGIASAVAWQSGCHAEAPPGRSTELPSRVSRLPAPAPPPSASAVASPTPKSAARDGGAPRSPAEPAEPADKPYTGPLLGATALQTPIYPTMEFTKKRLGYIRHGGKVPVDPTPIKTTSCSQGWYHLLDGGYVCGKYASADMKNPQVRLGVTAPNLDDILPYKYAYNTGHGTPLYRSVPSKEDMIRYEPYLEMSKKARRKKGEAAAEEPEASPAPAPAPDPAPAPTPSDEAAAAEKANAVAAAVGLLDGGMPIAEEAPPPKPWWQQENEPGKAPNVVLADLEQDSDSTLAKRMVKGFFVAVDKSFGWNSRLWYKTTSGLVAPSDRMYIAKPPSSQGIDVPEGVKQIGFITGTKASKYTFDGDSVSVSGPIARFSAFGLTGVTRSHKTIIYRQTTEGWWMKGIDGTFTEPGSPPSELAPGEKWIDVNLTRKTLLAIEGDKPVYAALVSPGKRSKNKAKDHATIQGTFRIREKHIAVTMDGDGTVAGDLPYSIEDVPFVAYFDGSYALHGAFWHSNFGREMSHGCVNLSPLDAKKIFFWSEPKLPRGWHAVWATGDKRGTLVVIHE